MFRNKTARQHNFAVIPGADVPRSVFRMQQTRLQAFDASDIIPIMCEEVLPGDTWRHKEHVAARLATPIAPVLDNLDIETAYFWVPNRIVSIRAGTQSGATDWERLITGETALTVPLITPIQEAGPTWPVPVGSVWDHFGIPSGIYTAELAVNAIPFFGYFMIYNEWVRDQNLQEPWVYDAAYSQNTISNDITNGDGAEQIEWDMMPLRINKRHDYFTSSLPFAQKGAAVQLPLGTSAPVMTSETLQVTGAQASLEWNLAAGGLATTGYLFSQTGAGENNTGVSPEALPGGFDPVYPANLYADLATATSATINAIRLAVITQQILERDARGGSRYVENLLATWGVRLPDYTAQRPEYLGGSKYPVTNNPVAQTAAYDAEPASTASAIGNLGAESHAAGSNRTFTFAAHEHGYIIGIAWARATPTYQQGLRKHWGLRHTRFDFWDPKFANLGEQAVQTEEIYLPLNVAPAVTVWGYQEQGAEYRYTPNEVTGVVRSTAPAPLDWWHYAEEFATEPALNSDFITDKTKETLQRSLATFPNAQWSAQIIFNVEHDSQVARIMPAYSVPGIDRM